MKGPPPRPLSQFWEREDIGVRGARTPAEIRRKTRPQTARCGVVRLPRLLSGFLKVDARGVDAVALPGRTRPIFEEMAEMPAATATQHFGPMHVVAEVVLQSHLVGIYGIPEAGPSTARIELGRGGKQLLPTPGAGIRSILFMVPVLSGESALGPLLPQDMILLRSQIFGPLFLGFYHFLFAHFILLRFPSAITRILAFRFPQPSLRKTAHFPTVRGRRLLCLQLDQDGPLFNFAGETADAEAGIVGLFAGADIELPGVPGAGHHLALQPALAERPFPMRARVIDTVERSVHIEQRQLLPARLHYFALSRRQFRHLRNFHPRHACFFSFFRPSPPTPLSHTGRGENRGSLHSFLQVKARANE